MFWAIWHHQSEDALSTTAATLHLGVAGKPWNPRGACNPESRGKKQDGGRENKQAAKPQSEGEARSGIRESVSGKSERNFPPGYNKAAQTVLSAPCSCQSLHTPLVGKQEPGCVYRKRFTFWRGRGQYAGTRPWQTPSAASRPAGDSGSEMEASYTLLRSLHLASAPAHEGFSSKQVWPHLAICRFTDKWLFSAPDTAPQHRTPFQYPTSIPWPPARPSQCAARQHQAGRAQGLTAAGQHHKHLPFSFRTRKITSCEAQGVLSFVV